MQISGTGSNYGVAARHNRDEPLVEFYDQRQVADPKGYGQRIASHYADQILRLLPARFELVGPEPRLTITAANCEQIIAWLRKEIVKPWVPPPPPPRPLPDTPTGSIEAGHRKATIFIGRTKHEVTWLEVSVARYAQYENAYHILFKPKRARHVRKYIESYKPQTIILEGWGHPEFGLLLMRENSHVTRVSIGDDANNDGGVMLANYLESLPLSQILLDTRGVIVDEIKWE